MIGNPAPRSAVNGEDLKPLPGNPSKCWTLTSCIPFCQANGCRDLRIVCLKRRKGLGNVGVTSLMKSCPKIKHLDLGFCNRITDQALEAIGASNCLEVLLLNGCKLVTDRGLASLALGSTATTLKRLDLSYCDRITDRGVSLLKHLSCLQELNLEGCGQEVTDSGGMELGAIQTLEKINFSLLINISDVSLLVIARHCSNLKEIKVSGCESVTGDGVCAFSQHISLEAMVLACCSNVHSEDIEQIVLGCPNLGYLGLDRDLKHWIPASVIERIDGRCQIEWL
ncbi:hypothetical protein SUGI_0599470 [Cryptomeria japonica]|uniref:F-box/LRR-repeat protein 4 isoform X2 n=1 Tax=Cryptomeria japonica TaxID=3369 RepID=UPI002414CADF|nr:F-box/LRR-repeat protein 4 isoform X2 [Cryptomeria japonica]GLJ30301.1 hypothetical protein SUGI_0599470 [Cryptomeria japonica]